MITFKKTDAACVCMFARVCVILAEADKDLRWRKVDIILNYAENLRRVNKFFAFNHIILKYGAMDVLCHIQIFHVPIFYYIEGVASGGRGHGPCSRWMQV